VEIQAYEFRLLEFADRTGTVRTVAGCSLLGREEFFARLSRLQELFEAAKPGLSLQDLWLQSTELRHQITKLLELNAIDPDWVTLEQAAELLLSPGTLVTHNLPPQRPAAPKSAPSTTEDTLAALASHCGLREALDLAENYRPANRLLAVVESKAALIRRADPKQRQKDQAKDAQRRAREDIERMRGGAA
jgi:hypothetical protein